MTYLTVKEVADLRGCTERYIQKCVSSGSIKSQESYGQNHQRMYLIPIEELTHQEQLKYYKKHGITIPEELLAGRKPKAQRPHKELDEFSADQREEIAQWIRILNSWDEYCAKSKLQKVAATEKFVQIQQVTK